VSTKSGELQYGDNKWNDAAIYLGPDPNQKILFKKGVREWIEIPLVVDREIIGSICIDNKYQKGRKKVKFGTSDCERLRDYITSAAYSIYNLGKYHTTYEKARAWEHLRKVDGLLLVSNKLENVLKEILKLAIEFTGADTGYIRLKSGNYLNIVCEIGHINKLLPGVRIDLYEKYRTAKVYKDKQYCIVHDAQSDLEFMEVIKMAQSNRNMGLLKDLKKRESFGIFPIKYPLGVEETVAGVLVLGSNKKDLFREDMCNLIEGFCQKAAAVIIMEEKKEYIKEMEMADKMMALGTLVAGIAHEIKNPLTILNVGIERVKNDLLNMEQNIKQGVSVGKIRAVNSYINKIVKAYNNIEKTTNSLNEFSHPGDDEFSTIDIHNVMDDALDLVKGKIKGRAKIEIKYSKYIPNVVGNYHMIQQTFVNILLNAGDAVDRNGIIRIQTNKILDHVIIKISNTGAPIPQSIKSKIFEPFFTTKKVGKGMGLGLSLVYNHIQRHGGSIKVDRINKETIFIITLPISQVS